MSISLSTVEAKEQEEFINDLSRTVDEFLKITNRMANLRKNLADRGEASAWMAEGTYGYEVAGRIGDAATVIDVITTALDNVDNQYRAKLNKVTGLRGA